jgi:hypothetical protein
VWFPITALLGYTYRVLHEKLFTQNSRELLFVWERIRYVIPALRESFKNANLASNMENSCEYVHRG